MSPDAIITSDEAGVILGFNAAAERMFGYASAEAVGRDVSFLMPEPHRARHHDYMRRYLDTGEARIIGSGREVRAMRRSGELFAVDLNIGVLHRPAGTIFVGILRDISERVEALRRAGRLQSRLDRMNRIHAVGELSAAISHELNQPLTAIASFAQAARQTLDAAGEDPLGLGPLVDRMAEQAVRSGEIVKRMRRLVERGRVDPRPVDINETVREALRLAESGFEKDGVHVSARLGDDLPPVLADPIPVQQCIVNLVRNAIEASMEVEGTEVTVATEHATDLPTTIEVAATQAGDAELVVSISDDGPGLPPGGAERLFEPFSGGQGRGLGIGLAICRSIVHAHGGRIWAENNEGPGATFHFTLPVAGSA